MTPPQKTTLPLFGALLALAFLWGGCQLSPLCEASFENGQANACGGCALLEDDPGDPCGHRGSGALVCAGTEALICEGAKTLEDTNSCGGLETLPGKAGYACGPCSGGIWACLGPDEMICGNDPGANECGGCGVLDEPLGGSCGVCGTGTWQCLGNEGVACEGESPGEQNACGGCGVLEQVLGEPCGACGDGVWACDGAASAACVGAAEPNICGGCGILDADPGEACGACGKGVMVCDGPALVCEAPQAGANACGGCVPLRHEPGDPCGPCGRDAYVCASPDVIVCNAATGCFADVSPDFIIVPSTDEDDRDRGQIERLGFTIQTTPVTSDQWRRLMSPQTPPQSLNCADCPQEGLSWADAVAFVNQMSFEEGLEACYDMSECEGEPGEGLECGDISFRGLGCGGWRLPTWIERAHILSDGQTSPIGLADGPLDTEGLDEQQVLRPVRSF